MRTEVHERAADRAAADVLREHPPDLVRSGPALHLVTRTFMETRFLHDFSRVRVHADAAAAESAHALNALAYTSGTDIFLGRQAPPLHSAAGQRLLSTR